MATGVKSFQLKGTPVASGVVNRFDSVMMMLCGSPADFLTSRKPSAPAPPPLLTVMIGCLERLFLATTPWMKRAIWSAPPPVPAGITNWMGLVGSQDWAAAVGIASGRTSAPAQRANALPTQPDREELRYRAMLLSSY